MYFKIYIFIVNFVRTKPICLHKSVSHKIEINNTKTFYNILSRLFKDYFLYVEILQNEVMMHYRGWLVLSRLTKSLHN